LGFRDLILQRHLRRYPGFGLVARVAARRHHPGDLSLPFRRDAAYYIIIFVPMHLEQQGHYREADSWVA
jgi:hypothetical protein